MIHFILPFVALVAQENLPTIENLEEKRQQLQMQKDKFKSSGAAIKTLEEELAEAQKTGNEEVIKAKKEALEAAKKEQAQAFEGLQDMRKERREDIPGYKEYKKQNKQAEESQAPTP